MSHWADCAAMLAVLTETIKSFEAATAVVYGTVLFCECVMTVDAYSLLLPCIFSMLPDGILLSLG